VFICHEFISKTTSRQSFKYYLLQINHKTNTTLTTTKKQMPTPIKRLKLHVGYFIIIIIIINMGVRVSLHVPRLIPRALKLTTM